MEVRLLDAVGGQVEDRWHVARHLEQGPKVAVLETAVDQGRAHAHLAERYGQVEGDRSLADPAFRREDRYDATGPRCLGLAIPQDVAQRVDQFEAAERERENGIYPTIGVSGERMLRHGQYHNGHVEAGVAQLLDQLRPLHLALQQQIDHHHVGP